MKLHEYLDERIEFCKNKENYHWEESTKKDAHVVTEMDHKSQQWEYKARIVELEVLKEKFKHLKD